MLDNIKKEPKKSKMSFLENTCLVLGAGASAPYQFPLGPQLKQLIQEFANQLPGRPSPLLDHGFSLSEINEFRKSLERSYGTTIDNFLENRPSFNKMGSIAIASILAEYEKNSNVFPKNSWYRYIYDAVAPNKADPSLISGIITFNYDRSLEFFLYETALRTHEGKPLEDALLKIEKLPIIHIHGSLGKITEFEFEEVHTTEAISEAAQRIRLVHDIDVDDSDGVKTARKLIADSSETLIIGLGYDERNLKRIDLLNNSLRCKIFGTGVGIPSSQWREIVDLFNKKINQTNSGQSIAEFLSHELPKFREQSRIDELIGT